MTSQDEDLPRLDGPAPGVELKAAPDDGRPDFDSFRAAPLDPGDDESRVIEAGAGGEFDLPPEAEKPVIGKAEFYQVFAAAFSVPAMIDQRLEPVAVQPGEERPARAASDALHDLLAVYYPRALSPMNDQFAQAMVLGGFCYGKYKIAMACLATPAAPAFKSGRDGATLREEGASDGGAE